MKGIDVSKWQGSIDFAKVKNSGMDFVIINAGYGKEINQKDKYFEQNYYSAKSAGLYVGAYWYSYASSVENAIREAQTCIEAIKGKQFDFPIYFDIEEQKQFQKGRDFCDSIVKAFCNELEKNGYYAGFYISRSPLQTYISESVAKRYALWIAEYGGKCNYNGQYGMWQYSSEGNVPGVNGNCDMNIAYIDYPSIIQKGFNGYQIKSVDEIANEIIQGKWGNGDERKQKLVRSGYDYNSVQQKVNEILKRKSVDEIAYEVIQGKWGNGIERKQKLEAAGYNYSEVQNRVNKLM